MTLQEIFNKAVEHFAKMKGPSINRYGMCAYRGLWGNKCIVGAFIDDEHYDEDFEGRMLDYRVDPNNSEGYLPWMETRRFQPLSKALAASMGVESLSHEQRQLLLNLQHIHDDLSTKFVTANPLMPVAAEDSNEWWRTVRPHLEKLADDFGLEYK